MRYCVYGRVSLGSAEMPAFRPSFRENGAVCGQWFSRIWETQGCEMPTRRDSRAPNNQRHLTRHEIAIRMLVNSDPSIHRNGFRAAARELWAEINVGNEWPDDPPDMDFLPDAYRIDRETETLVIYEVEDSNPISPAKLAKLGWFWFCWDAEDYHDWLPKLVTVDHYGRITGEIDMCGLYYSAVLDQHRPSA